MGAVASYTGAGAWELACAHVTLLAGTWARVCVSLLVCLRVYVGVLRVCAFMTLLRAGVGEFLTPVLKASAVPTYLLLYVVSGVFQVAPPARALRACALSACSART
eukprot:3155299-Pleurochrysis_carterae.AAC.1